MTKLPFPRFFLMVFLFFLPSLQMSHAGQSADLAAHASEVAKTANPSVGSGDWIGPSLFFVSNGFQKFVNPIADHSVAVWGDVSRMGGIDPLVVGPSLIRRTPTEERKRISVGEKQNPDFFVGGFIHDNATDGRINLNNLHAFQINQLGAEGMAGGNPSGMQIEHGGGGGPEKSANEHGHQIECGCGCCGYDLGYHVKRAFFFLIGGLLGMATALGLAWWMFRPTPLGGNYR